MIRKFLAVAILVSLIAGVAHAESRRTVYTMENKMPEMYQPELGATVFYRELPEEYDGDPRGKDQYTTTPYGRVGITENFAVFGALPIEYVSPSSGDTEVGLGDAEVGFELVAWEDIFGYPYFLPYAKISFPTGNEDKGLGAGTMLTTLGMSIGTTTYDVLDWVADAQYTIYRDEQNVARFSGSLIWNLSDIFAVLGEIRVTDEQQSDEKDSTHPVYLLGGLSYEPNEDWIVNVHGGGSSSGESDVLIGVKVAYTF